MGNVYANEKVLQAIDECVEIALKEREKFGRGDDDFAIKRDDCIDVGGNESGQNVGRQRVPRQYCHLFVKIAARALTAYNYPIEVTYFVSAFAEAIRGELTDKRREYLKAEISEYMRKQGEIIPKIIKDCTCTTADIPLVLKACSKVGAKDLTGPELYESINESNVEDVINQCKIELSRERAIKLLFDDALSLLDLRRNTKTMFRSDGGRIPAFINQRLPEAVEKGITKFDRKTLWETIFKEDKMAWTKEKLGVNYQTISQDENFEKMYDIEKMDDFHFMLNFLDRCVRAIKDGAGQSND